MIKLRLALVLGTSAIHCTHLSNRTRHVDCVRQAQLVHGILSKVCLMNFSRTVLKPSSTSICESPVRLSIVVSHAGGLLLLCQIFHLRASFRANFRPDLPFAYHFCKHDWSVWTPVGSKLCSAPQYQNEFMDPPDAAEFVYFLVRGNPALEKAGRKRRQPTTPLVTFAQRPFGACSVNLPCWN